MQVGSKVVVSLVSVLGVIACGDDDGGTGGTGGVSRNKKLTDLSEAEARTFCRTLQGKFDDVAEATADFSCTAMAALTSGGNASMCQSSITECKETFDAPFEELDCDGEEGMNGGLSADCNDVTVGELTDCMDANAKAIEDLAGKVSCSTDADDISDLSTSSETPAACAKIEAKCPDVADMESEL
ncbi:MAG TPA: hypothetical protein VFX59_02600 [Polyangiales bacterium]|nr:hypothetical protein [Polyangiales bacterium]